MFEKEEKKNLLFDNMSLYLCLVQLNIKNKKANKENTKPFFSFFLNFQKFIFYSIISNFNYIAN